MLSILPKGLETILRGDILKLEQSLTTVSAFQNNSMASCIKQNKEQVYSCIELLIIKTAMSLNVGKNIEPHQAPAIAQAIYKRYYKFSIEEVALVLRKGRAGEFGKLYDRLDEMIIMDWFQKYDCSEERDALVQNARIEAEKKDKDEQDSSLSILMNNINILELSNKLNGEKEIKKQNQESFNEFRKEYLKNKLLNNHQHETGA